MTIQARDYISIGRKKYTLIDVEEGKQIITCANFVIPKYKNWYKGYTASTACCRGYMAEYYIIKKSLYGIKLHDYFSYDLKEQKIKKTRRLFIPYTGSCIIAYGDGWNSDFLSSYLDYNEAFELYFEKGIIVEKLTLLPAIEKMRSLSESEEYINKMEPYQRCKIRDDIARENLKYKYDTSSYKWRDINENEDMEN